MSRFFFYGLFMDRSLLIQKGLHPEVIGPAALPDYRIHIGERATLVRSPASRAYGLVMELADEEARALYSDPSVRDYAPERVQVKLLDASQTVEADCYNLPPEFGLAGANPSYATKLSQLAEALQFDSAYVDEIGAFAGPELVMRPATPVEKEALEALQRRASLANPGDRANLLAHPDAIELPMEQIESQSVIVAQRGSTVLGFAAVVLREDGDAELDALFVEPSSWKRGIGRELVEQCVELAGSLGATSLHVVGNPHAEEFYTRCGFTLVGTTETRFGSGLLMERPVE